MSQEGVLPALDAVWTWSSVMAVLFHLCNGIRHVSASSPAPLVALSSSVSLPQPSSPLLTSALQEI